MIPAERKTPMPAKITLAGENTYKIHFRGILVQELTLTRLTPPETVAENALRTLTVGPNHFVNRSSPLLLSSNSRTRSWRKVTMAEVDSHDCNLEARGCVRRSFFVCFWYDLSAA